MRLLLRYFNSGRIPFRSPSQLHGLVEVDEQQVVVLVLRPLVEDERLERCQAGGGRESGQQRKMVSD